MNEVARSFWNEIHDVRRPLPTEDRRQARQREKLVRRVVTRRSARTSAQYGD